MGYQEALLMGRSAGCDELVLLEAAQREDGVRGEVVVHGQPQLLEVVRALGSPGRFARRLHGGQEQRDQDGNDRDHDQQFDQSKSAHGAVSWHGYTPVCE